jgi:hypothetical protein
MTAAIVPPTNQGHIAQYFEGLYGDVVWTPSSLIARWLQDFGDAPTEYSLIDTAARVWRYKEEDPAKSWGQPTGRAHIASASAEEDAEPRFAPLTVDTWFAKDYPEAHDLVEGLLPDEGYGAIIASEKVGKSLLAMQLTLCVATGTMFMGRRVRKAPALYIEEEGSERKARERLHRQVQKFDGMALGSPAYFVHGQQLRLDSQRDLDALDSLILETAAKLVILGPLAQVSELSDENAATEMSKVNRILTALAKRHHCVVLLIHHRRKDDEYRSIRSFFSTTRGSNALMAAIDVAIGLDRDVEQSEGKFLVLHRDGSPIKEGYSLDLTSSLCAFPAAIPDRRKAPLKDVHDALLAEPQPITSNRLASKLGVDRKTCEARLYELEREGLAVVDHSKGTASYWRGFAHEETATIEGSRERAGDGKDSPPKGGANSSHQRRPMAAVGTR